MRGNHVILHGEDMIDQRNWKPLKVLVRLSRSLMLDLFSIAENRGETTEVMLKNVIREYARKNAPGKHYGGDRSTTATAEVVRRIEITLKESQK